MEHARQTSSEPAAVPSIWKPIAQILVGLFIATQPYHGVAGIANGEIADPTAGEIVYIAFVIALGLAIVAFGVRKLIHTLRAR